jgi:hypothetical protein
MGRLAGFAERFIFALFIFPGPRWVRIADIICSGHGIVSQRAMRFRNVQGAGAFSYGHRSWSIHWRNTFDTVSVESPCCHMRRTRRLSAPHHIDETTRSLMLIIIESQSSTTILLFAAATFNHRDFFQYVYYVKIYNIDFSVCVHVHRFERPARRELERLPVVSEMAAPTHRGNGSLHSDCQFAPCL